MGIPKIISLALYSEAIMRVNTLPAAVANCGKTAKLVQDTQHVRLTLFLRVDYNVAAFGEGGGKSGKQRAQKFAGFPADARAIR
jgi:hypothetical protein